jgi:hypothetical protein
MDSTINYARDKKRFIKYLKKYNVLEHNFEGIF